jgi:predicted esterase
VTVPLSFFAGLVFAALHAPPAIAHGAWGVAYAPEDTTAPRPVILYLHGMWATPEDSCGVFARASIPFGFLVCPRGNALMPKSLGDGPMWAGTYASVAPAVHAALRAAEAAAPGKLARAGDGTIVGYSNGAYFAAEIARAEPGKWSGLVLLSMRLDLDAARLRAAGIRRIVLAAGDRDGARASMKALAEKVDGAGLPTRFMSLGAVGHEFPRDMERQMCAAVAWVRAEDPDRCAPALESRP